MTPRTSDGLGGATHGGRFSEDDGGRTMGYRVAAAMAVRVELLTVVVRRNWCGS